METLTKPPTEPTEPRSVAAAADAASSYRRWVMLERYSCSGVADGDARTSAASFTSACRPFRVSFSLTAPPASSTLYFDWAGSSDVPGEADDDDDDDCSHCVIAANDGCVLFEMKRWLDKYNRNLVLDYFLYEAGGCRPPSLSLLPACYLPDQWTRRRAAEAEQKREREGWCYGYREQDQARPRDLEKGTGLLRRHSGGDNVARILVAQLDLLREEPWDTVELCVFRGHEWELHRGVPVVHNAADNEAYNNLMRGWQTDEVVAVGDQTLCWVDYVHGFLVCDDIESTPPDKLRYVALPFVPPKWPSINDRPYMRWSRALVAAGTGAAVRFVNIEPRCCCGGHGRTTCARGRWAFTVAIWTLNLTTHQDTTTSTWAKDRVLDCDELWGLPGYDGLPRVAMEYPVVSLEDPDIVFFRVSSVYQPDVETKVWVVEVDTRRNVLKSVFPSTGNMRPESYVPALLRF